MTKNLVLILLLWPLASLGAVKGLVDDVTGQSVDPDGRYATTAQGSTADTAVQPGDDAADLGSGAANDGYVLSADGAGGAAWEVSPGGVSDHGALTGLGDDDHAQYPLMAGRAGGQVIYGGLVGGDVLNLIGSASNATGKVVINELGETTWTVDNTSANPTVSIRKSGSSSSELIASTAFTIGSQSGALSLTAAGGIFTNGLYLNIGSSAYDDVRLYRGGSDKLFQRRATFPQASWLANTYTDTNNYESAVIDWIAITNTLRIGAIAAGTGTVRPVEFVGSAFAFNADAIRVVTDRTPSSSSATCTTGEQFSDANYLYKCTATNTIKRISWSTF